ncbi:MAG: FAD-dependent oxidoreductase [Deltaproteobacteria bacterium]|nr:FAD-dependent oxidoreductase [Deltaproteobacteria bacterium]
MKIAILGSGIAGLACADRLGTRHDVTLFEAEPRLGGHAHTVDVEVAGTTHAVDTGFIVYNETTYPELTRLLDELGVATRPAEMSFGLSCEPTGLEWSSRGLRGLFATPELAFRPPFLRMVFEILRFAREAPALLDEHDTKTTLRELVAKRGYSDRFRDDYLAPMGAAIWSAGTDALLDMPAVSFVRFFHNHGLLGRGGGIRWRTIVGGSRGYVDALARRIRGRIALSTPVLGVRSEPKGVAVQLASGTERFDRVVFAVHADTALALLESPTREQRRILGAIRFSRNETVLHTDVSLLPRREAARASWNSLVSGASRERVVVTYDLSRLQSIPSAEPLLVTLNGSDRIDPARVLGRFDYAHPILDGPAIDAQREHARIDGVGGTHFCGAWWRWGFHEDGLASALRVVQAIEAIG